MKTKKQTWVFFSFILIFIYIVSSCTQEEKKEPLKPTQMYGKENHLLTRSLLAFQPQPDAFALISPSVKQIVSIFFKTNNFTDNKIIKGVLKQTAITTLLKENEEQTIDNIKTFGINIEKACAFFYTPDDKWQAVLPVDNFELFTKKFPNATKNTLKTSWLWFISGKYSAYWDNANKIAFMDYKGYLICSNDISTLTQTVMIEENVPSFYYGLDGTPILSENEVVILLSITDELKKKLLEPSYEPNWLKTVLLTLEKTHDEICLAITSENDSNEIALAIRSKNNSANTNKKPELIFSEILPNNSLAMLDIALTNEIRQFLPNLLRNDTQGDLKKRLNKIVGVITSPLISDELSIGIYKGSEIYPDIVFCAKSTQVENAKGLLRAVAVDDEPIGDFSTLKADLLSMLKIPLVINIALKDPYIFLSNNRARLIEVVDKATYLALDTEHVYPQDKCSYGFLRNDTDNIKALLDNNKTLLDSNNLETIGKILPLISEVCLYEKEPWHLMKVKITL